jgi:hypothetical protein
MDELTANAAYWNLRVEYRKLLGLVQRIKTGEVDPKLVTLWPDNWQIDAPKSEPLPDEPKADLTITPASEEAKAPLELNVS